MLTKIQEGGTWSLNLNLEPVEYTHGVRMRFQTQEIESKNPNELRTSLDIHLSPQEFNQLKEAILNFKKPG